MSTERETVEEWLLGRIPSPRFTPAIVDIFRYISAHDDVQFKSQQIDDPVLSRSERYLLAEQYFMRNKRTFLLRFGPYLEEAHLHDFAQHAIDEHTEHYQDMQLIIKELQKKLQRKQTQRRNRRFDYMQKMIKNGDDYFSEHEMMRREPELYQELVGQYLSAADIAERDNYDIKSNSALSDIIWHQWSVKDLKNIIKEADDKNQLKVDINEEEAASIDKDKEAETATATKAEVEDFGKQWGNFEDEEVPCTSKKAYTTEKETEMHKQNSLRENKSRNVLITATERKLLRQEFFSIMKEKFLNGQDDNFYYGAIDNDEDLDDLEQLNRDAEDAYFAESDSDVSDYTLMAEAAGTSDEEYLDDYMNYLVESLE